MKPHVVVIGGGITGTLTARELALAGHAVTLLEAAHIGAGSSSRTAAGIRQQFSTPGTVRAMRYAVDFYRRFAEETEDGTSPIIQNGYLFLHDDASAWAGAVETVQVQKQAGLTEVEALSPDELVKRATGEALSPQPFLAYLREKFGALYGVELTPEQAGRLGDASNRSFGL